MRRIKGLLAPGISLICLLFLGLLLLGDRRAVQSLTPQAAAARWETAEKPYAMASVFLAPDRALDPNSLGAFRLSVEKSMTAGGTDPETWPWFFGASRSRDAVLRNESASSSVELTVVDGEFFRIHPMKLISGWYPDPEGVMRDGIVLSRRTAWDLFYSDNVVGMFVELEGARYRVAAVVEEEPGRYNALAAGDTRRAWALWDSPGLGEDQGGFTCMELVVPQPVKGFAAGTLKSALGTEAAEDQQVTDNSGRFSLPARLRLLRQLSTRSISGGAAAYPYWENAARLVEERLARNLIPEGLLLAVPLIYLLLVLRRLNRRRTWGLRSIPRGIETLVDRKHQRDYEKLLANRETNKAPALPPEKAADEGGTKP